MELRDTVEALFTEHGLSEVMSTWDEDPPASGGDDESLVTRDVLEAVDDHSPDLDELLLVMREHWQLELNVDRETNVDDAGRHLGMTLWHAIVLATSNTDDNERGAYITVWMTAGSLAQAEELLEDALLDHPEWVFESVYTMDRVAFDDRPPSLSSLPTTRRRAAMHELEIEEWGDGTGDSPSGGGPGGGPGSSPGSGPGGRGPSKGRPMNREPEPPNADDVSPTDEPPSDDDSPFDRRGGGGGLN
jgi:hypothetical protein